MSNIQIQNSHINACYNCFILEISVNNLRGISEPITIMYRMIENGLSLAFY